MGQFQIVRTKQHPPAMPPEHTRIVEVEIAGGHRSSVQEIVASIDRNEHQFWVADPDTRKGVWVTTYQRNATTRHIRTAPNSTKKDNLDSLPTYT